MAVREVDAIDTAIAETEKEIAGEAWGNEETTLDETGDRSLESLGDGLEGQHELDDDSDDEETDDESETEGDAEVQASDGKDAPEAGKPNGKDATGEQPPRQVEGEPPARVPGRVVREASERARKAEAERDELRKQLEAKGSEASDTRKQLDALTQRFEGFISAQRQPPSDKKEEPAKRPDIFENPEGFVEHVEQGVTQKLTPVTSAINDLRVNTSMQIAEAVHGEKFTKAYSELTALDPRDPENRVTVARIVNSLNPGKSLMDWHGKQETLRRVGNDPAKFENDIREQTRQSLMKDPEFIKQVVAGLRSEASQANNGRPRSVFRAPPSLNGASGSNLRQDADPQMYDDSDEAVAQSAWRD